MVFMSLKRAFRLATLLVGGLSAVSGFSTLPAFSMAVVGLGLRARVAPSGRFSFFGVFGSSGGGESALSGLSGLSGFSRLSGL